MYKAILITRQDNYAYTTGDLVQCCNTKYNSQFPLNTVMFAPQDRSKMGAVEGWDRKHLIITSDEEIKEGDYVYSDIWKQIYHAVKKFESGQGFEFDKGYAYTGGDKLSKIIASTNPEHHLSGIESVSIQQWIDAGCPEEVNLLTEYKEDLQADIMGGKELLKLVNNQVTIVPKKKAQWEDKVFQATSEKKIEVPCSDSNEQCKHYVAVTNDTEPELEIEVNGCFSGPGVSEISVIEAIVDMAEDKGWHFGGGTNVYTEIIEPDVEQLAKQSAKDNEAWKGGPFSIREQNYEYLFEEGFKAGWAANPNKFTSEDMISYFKFCNARSISGNPSDKALAVWLVEYELEKLKTKL